MKLQITNPDIGAQLDKALAPYECEPHMRWYMGEPTTFKEFFCDVERMNEPQQKSAWDRLPGAYTMGEIMTITGESSSHNANELALFILPSIKNLTLKKKE